MKDTGNDHHELAKLPQGKLQLAKQRWLGDRPQLLGILPTLWFWQDTNNWKRVRGLIGVTVGITCMTLGMVGPGILTSAGMVGPGILTGAVIGGGTVILVTGIIERIVRSRAKRRKPFT